MHHKNLIFGNFSVPCDSSYSYQIVGLVIFICVMDTKTDASGSICPSWIYLTWKFIWMDHEVYALNWCIYVFIVWIFLNTLRGMIHYGSNRKPARLVIGFFRSYVIFLFWWPKSCLWIPSSLGFRLSFWGASNGNLFSAIHLLRWNS